MRRSNGWKRRSLGTAKDSKIAKTSTIDSWVWCRVLLQNWPARLALSSGLPAREAFLLYLGMSTLDNRSGKYQGTKAPKHVNTRAKAAMMIALDRHRKYVPESQRYYAKKRSEGKKHNQAVRALGRHISRIIYKMLTEEREYRIGPEKGNTKSQGRSEIVRLKRNIRRPKIFSEDLKYQSLRAEY